MKLPIKQEYFNLIKQGKKRIDFRDAHITFICDETGETLYKEVDKVRLLINPGIYPDVLEDKNMIAFELK